MVQAIINTVKDKNNYLYEKYIEFGKTEGYIDETIPTSTIIDFINAVNTQGNNQIYGEQTSKYNEDMVNMLLYGLLIKK